MQMHPFTDCKLCKIPCFCLNIGINVHQNSSKQLKYTQYTFKDKHK